MWRMSMVMRVSPATAVTTPGQHCATPDRRDAVVALADLGDLEREPRRGAEAVAPHLHRHRAGVRGLTAEDQSLALDALGAGDRADAATHRLEDRALLDVHLDVRLHVGHARAGAVEVVDVDAVLGEHLGQLVALLVGQPAQHLDVERADTGRRAEQAAAEPSALLVGPVDQRDGDRRRAFGGERRSSSRPDITPSAPSSQPPFGTLSRWLPTTSMSSRSPRSTAHRLPASSSSTSTGKRGQRLAQHRPRLQPVGRPRKPAAALGAAGVIGQGAQVGDDSFGDA